MTTPQRTYRDIIADLVSPAGSVVSLADIYKATSERVTFDEDDLRPPTLRNRATSVSTWRNSPANAASSEGARPARPWALLGPASPQRASHRLRAVLAVRHLRILRQRICPSLRHADTKLDLSPFKPRDHRADLRNCSSVAPGNPNNFLRGDLTDDIPMHHSVTFGVERLKLVKELFRDHPTIERPAVDLPFRHRTIVGPLVEKLPQQPIRLRPDLMVPDH